jgi:uncharacterized protein (DUF1800 family)
VRQNKLYVYLERNIHLMDRKSFLEVLTQRRQAFTSGSASLDPYTGPWTERQAIHLLRRTTFGFAPDEVQPFVQVGMQQAVNQILDNSAPMPPPPVNVYSTPQLPDPDAAYGQTWVNAPFNPGLPVEYYQARTDVLKAWWVGLMIQSPLNIREKMTLFWQNHFAIEADVVEIAQPMYYYLAELRENCLGNFKELTKTITLTPAMLRYLNGYLNAKAQPDENYARELHELFTAGKGPDSKFTEDDIKATARILTGFRINPFTSPISMFFDFTQHDTGNKSFSSFYGNTVISGKFGAAGANELDDLLNMIFANQEVSKFICRKLYQFFVYYDITPEIEDQIITPLAEVFRNNNYQVYPVMETLLKSEHFYDTLSMGCIIKSPLDFSVGVSRTFKIQYPSPAPDPQILYRSWGVTAYYAAATGLNVLDPPLVAGYPAWYQAPVFMRAWINSDTLASRLLFVNAITSGSVDVGGAELTLEPIRFAEALPSPVDPNQLVADAIDILYGLPVSQNTLNYFKSFLLGGLDDFYWSNLWNDYITDPGNQEVTNQINTRLLAMLREIMQQAEYHLS